MKRRWLAVVALIACSVFQDSPLVQLTPRMPVRSQSDELF
jgi:hypothetical protein